LLYRERRLRQVALDVLEGVIEMQPELISSGVIAGSRLVEGNLRGAPQVVR
jgi:hypothetical protein